MRQKPALYRIILNSFILTTVVLGSASMAQAEQQFGLRIPQTAIEPSAADDYAYDDAEEAKPDYLAEGEAETIRERYPDGKVRIERQVALDSEGNYANHGEWKMFNQNGEVVAEGHFEMGKRVGMWSRWHGKQDSTALSEFPFKHFTAPFHSQATFADGQMDGEWLITDSAQRKCMLISLSGGKRNGVVTMWLPNGTVHRQSTYMQGVPVGEVMENDPKTGQLKQIATYIEGRKVTTKTANSRRANAKKSEEQFLAATTVEKTPDDFWILRFAEYVTEGEDLRHGISKTWYDNGNISQEGYYQNGKKQGTFTYHYENGQIAATGEYVDDLPDNVWVWWHPNGQKSAVGKFRNGALISEWRWWNADGKRAGQKTYDGTQMFSAQPQEALETGLAPTEEQTR